MKHAHQPKKQKGCNTHYIWCGKAEEGFSGAARAPRSGLGCGLRLGLGLRLRTGVPEARRGDEVPEPVIMGMPPAVGSAAEPAYGSRTHAGNDSGGDDCGGCCCLEAVCEDEVTGAVVRRLLWLKAGDANGEAVALAGLLPLEGCAEQWDSVERGPWEGFESLCLGWSMEPVVVVMMLEAARASWEIGAARETGRLCLSPVPWAVAAILCLAA